MRYMDIKPKSRKDEFDWLMAQRKPQTKIPVLDANHTLDRSRSPLSIVSFENVILAVQRTQSSYRRSNVCEGMLVPNSDCARLGECSWFRHANDTYKKYGAGDNLPEGFMNHE